MKHLITTRSFVLVLIFLTFCISTSAAQEPAPEWTVDIARQLLAEGWDGLLADSGTTVVGYALHFVELKREALLSLGFEFDTSERGLGLWLLEDKNFAFNLLFDSQFHFKPDPRAELGHAQEKGKYDFWLLTMEGEPLLVKVSSARIPAHSTKHKGEKLEVRILPLHAQNGGQIQSEVSIIYETLSGSAVNVHTIAWVDGDPQRPIAVVSREVRTGKRAEYQYFALYLAGIVIPGEALPAERPYLKVGTIAGMQSFMAGTPVQQPIELGLGLAFHDGKSGVQASLSLPKGERHRVYGSIRTQPYTVYLLGAEGGLSQDLYLVGELSGGQETVLQVGLRDQLQLGENTKVSATVLPLCFTPAALPHKVEPNWRISLQHDFGFYEAWYQLENDAGQKQRKHQAGVTAFKDEKFGATLAWSWEKVHGSIFSVGVRLTF